MRDANAPQSGKGKWLPLLVGLMAVFMAVCIGTTVWAVFIRKPVLALAPDYAPQQVEENATAIQGDTSKKAEAPKGGGSVTLSFSSGVTVDLSERKAHLYYGHVGESNHDLILQLVIQDTVIAQTGVIKPGYQVTEVELLSNVQQDILLSPGVYEGKFVLLFYHPETGEKAMMNSEIPQTITVQE